MRSALVSALVLTHAATSANAQTIVTDLASVSLTPGLRALPLGSQLPGTLGSLTLNGGNGPLAVCNPITLQFGQPAFEPSDTIFFVGSGVPGTVSVILADLDPGPTPVPGLGDILIGFSPVFMLLIPPPMPASGQFTFPVKELCLGVPEARLYAQAVSFDLATLTACLSNGTSTLLRDTLGDCSQPRCVLTSSINSNFNGTPIAANRYIWFNAHIKVSDLGSSGAVGFRNSRISFSAGGNNYSVPVPDGTVTVSPNFANATTTYSFPYSRWATTVPASCSTNMFLTGVALHTGANGFPGGISPVAWSGEFSSSVPGASISWQWSAAVYTSFTSAYDQLGVKPVDGSCPSVYANSDHAGTPENFKGFVVGGARGGGGSNFTGSWSGTGSVICR